MHTLRFEKLSKFDRHQEPCAVSIPFAQGRLSDKHSLVIFDGEQPVPTQSVVTARWPDHSVKWLHTDFLADLPANQGKDFSWTTQKDAPPEPAQPVVIRHENGVTTLNTGAACLRLGCPGAQNPLEGVSIKSFAIGAGEIQGPSLIDESGTEWIAKLDTSGWRVLRNGPVHAIVEAAGKHINAEGNGLLDFQLRCHAFAGKPWFQLDYRIINREAAPHVMIKSLFIKIRPATPPSDAQTALAISNYKTRTQRGEAGERLRHCIDAEQLVHEGNEHTPEVFYGTFHADWTAPGIGGICVTMHQAHQNFPKALAVDKSGIDILLYPDSAPPLCIRRGIARTQRLLFHPFADDTNSAALDARSLQFQMPDRPGLTPDIYRAAGVFEPVWSEKHVNRVESHLLDIADNRIRAYGLLNWGDGPDPNYTNQGRGRGMPVWLNNEYDLPHAAMLMFARTGERRMLDYLLTTAEHQMDVDVCHFSPDPLINGGQIIHSAHHVSKHVTPSHEWVEGLIDLYHMTADSEALNTAISIGNNVLRHLERPEMREAAGASARETGWALRTLMALYRETGDTKWMEPATFIVNQFRDWQGQYGAWLAPYTDHTLVRVPFMIAVAASSLMRYYWVTENADVGNMIVTAMRDLIENALMPDGRFYYKELPSLQRRGAGMYVLESLAYAYDLSGDVAFIKAGLSTLEATVNDPTNCFGYKKYEVDDAVICDSGSSPKIFAASFMPMAMFTRAAVHAGLLE